MKKLKKLLKVMLIVILSSTLMLGCNGAKENTKQKNYDGRVFYEIFVRSFNDSNGDGIGDLNGVTEKLDYLKSLGVNGIWLMPINASSSYHGYDVDDYYSINKDYGTMKDFENLIKEAHKRNIKVIMDLVLNHTSVNNKWFKSAKESKNSPYRDYYIWSNDMSLKSKTSSMNTKCWSQNGNKQELYYSVFWSGMPDLNYDNDKVFNEVKKITKYYLNDVGVDGFRLDAAKWIYEDNTDKNVKFWKKYSDYVKSVKKNAIIVAEVWDSPYTCASYTNSLNSFFEFTTGSYVTNCINKQSISTFPDSYNSIKEIYDDENSNFVMAPFLSNHDENRVMDSLKDEFKMKMAAAMYLTLPGTPFIYYGEELGMKGSGADEKKRQPFTWSSTNKSLNTNWEETNYDTNTISYNAQNKDKDSILNFYRDILNVRNKYACLRYGKIVNTDTSDINIMAMKRSYKKENAYVIINGTDEKGTCNIKKGKYKVAYSNNKNRKDIVKSNGSISVSDREIMILIEK